MILNEVLCAVRSVLSQRMAPQGTSATGRADAAVDFEAEHIVLRAYQVETGERLSRMDLFSRDRVEVPSAVLNRALEWSAKRAQGVPMQYLTGTQSFLEHEFTVSPAVLVPRPETESMTARAIEELQAGAVGPRLGVELGLGSGAISVEILDRFPALRMVATEFSPGAIEIAKENARRILGEGAHRLEIVRVPEPLHVFEPLENRIAPRSVDFLISNPPYLVHDHEVEPEVRAHEPRIALFAPASDPLHFYRKVAEEAARVLRPGGRVWMEVPHERAESIQNLFEKQGWNAKIELDLAGRERVLCAQLS